MKKLYLFLLIAFLSSNVIGQVWVDKGAIWHYDFWTVGAHGFDRYSYVNDTLLDGHNCQVIEGESYAFTTNSSNVSVLLWHNILDAQYTYVSGDTVFYRKNGKFFVLLNFGANIGDSWVIDDTNALGWCDDTSRVVVTDTGHMVINSIAYRTITLQPTSNSPYGLKGAYVERFGNIDTAYAPFQYPFPAGYQCDSIPGIVEWLFYKFKCFEDSTFTMYNPLGQDCEFDLTHLGISESDPSELLCYPNPTQGLIFIANEFGDELRLQLYNNQGALLRTIEVSDKLIQIDLSLFPSGLYLLNIQSNHHGQFVKRIIKE